MNLDTEPPPRRVSFGTPEHFDIRQSGHLVGVVTLNVMTLTYPLPKATKTRIPKWAHADQHHAFKTTLSDLANTGYQCPYPLLYQQLWKVNLDKFSCRV